MRVFPVFSALLSLFVFNNIVAQKMTIDSTDVRQLEEVVVTAQYTPKSEKNTVYKVRTISAKQIQAKGANNLRELLLHEGLLNLSQNSVFGTSIEIQGISKENIKILIDGTPIVGRLNGIIDLNQINLSDIDRVEIIEGPVSVFYGTDASGGIINLITKKVQGEKIEGVLSSYYEDVNAININGGLGLKYGESMVRLNGGYYHFDGLSTNDALRNLNWEERSQYFSSIMYAKQLGDLTLAYNGRLSKEKLFSIGEPNRSGKIEDKEYHTRRIGNTLSLKGNVFQDKFINTTVSYLDYQRYHNTFDIDTFSFESVPSETDIKDDNIDKFNYAGFKTQLGKSNYPDVFNYALGFDLFREATEGGRVLDGKQHIFTSAFYGSINYKIAETIELQPSARYTWNSSYGSLFSPAFNGIIYWGNKHDHKLRFSYGRGFRAPSLKEIFLDFHLSAGPVTYVIKGNENLKVEKSHSLNLSYTFRTPLTNNLTYLSIGPSIFYNKISNLIALSKTVDFTRQYINVDEFQSVGGALSISCKASEALFLKTEITLLGRHNKFSEEYDTEEFLYTPEFSTNINYMFSEAKMAFNVFYKFSGERDGYLINPNTNSVSKISQKSYNNLDATVSKRFFDNTLNISVGIKNMFDIKDIETLDNSGQAHSRDLQLWGRSMFLKASIKF